MRVELKLYLEKIDIQDDPEQILQSNRNITAGMKLRWQRQNRLQPAIHEGM